ncbi:hypothetical protein AAFF_G00124110 [Aldrovandia affinis]|uniref:Uncharacterized protein n=1 Tax=Aldrovandia affinis TaxID=143900 RepID=A0AAD7RRF3_9TELE|nr:hypothetical protein AAFF_G00124110 [Aldrovandia affinis]
MIILPSPASHMRLKYGFTASPGPDPGYGAPARSKYTAPRLLICYFTRQDLGKTWKSSPVRRACDALNLPIPTTMPIPATPAPSRSTLHIMRLHLSGANRSLPCHIRQKAFHCALYSRERGCARKRLCCFRGDPCSCFGTGLIGKFPSPG